jgi:hypothetical protein
MSLTCCLAVWWSSVCSAKMPSRASSTSLVCAQRCFDMAPIVPRTRESGACLGLPSLIARVVWGPLVGGEHRPRFVGWSCAHVFMFLQFLARTSLPCTSSAFCSHRDCAALQTSSLRSYLSHSRFEHRLPFLSFSPFQESICAVDSIVGSGTRKVSRGKRRGLKETNVAVLKVPQQDWSEVLLCLSEHHFRLVGLRMAWLTSPQERLVADAMDTRLAPATLSSSPVLLLAVERDNAVVCAKELLCRSLPHSSQWSLTLTSPTDRYSLSAMWGSQLLMATSVAVVCVFALRILPHYRPG